MRQDPPGFEDPQFLDHLVAKVLAGEAAPAEVTMVNQQLALPVASRSGTLSFDQATNSLHTLPVPPRFDAHLLWHRLQTRLATREGRPLGRGKRFKAHPLRRGLWSVTSGVIMGLVGLMIGVTVSVRLTRHGTETSVPLVYSTTNGERATVTLPDGGTVMLNVASRLEVPVDYKDGNHTVRLVGEGLFTGSHQKSAPLTVLAGGTAARVLGTSFVVRRYTTDTATLVAVREGKVAVGSTVVAATQALSIGSTGASRRQTADPALFTFATGVLTLNGVPLSAAIEELDRWYDTDIRIGGPIAATHRLQGEFAAGSLTDLVDILEHTLDVQVIRDGRVLTLYPRQ
jgi:ferric-dicitrate binding protein FerR (iron transport regulator)